MRSLVDNALNLADANGPATQISPAIDASSWMACSCIAVALGGTITGTLKLQASNDLVSPTNWVDLTGRTVSVTSAGSFLIPTADISHQWVRVIYTKTTSAAGAFISAQIKSIGF